MSSVISIGIGQCGIRVQESQWDLLIKEQGLDRDGVYTPQAFEQRLNVYFNEIKENIYKPRAVLLDLDSSSIDCIENGPLKRLMMGTQMISMNECSNGSYAQSFYTHGPSLRDQILEGVRQEVEKCDRVDSIQVLRSVAGGAGSGLGNIVTTVLQEAQFTKMVTNLVHFPANSEGSNIDRENGRQQIEQNNDNSGITSVYNTALAFVHLSEESDIVLPFQNGQIFQLFDEQASSLNEQNAMRKANNLIAQMLPAMTCGLRFPGSINASSLKIATNLIPFPRIKYIQTSLLPYYNILQMYNPDYTELIPLSFQSKYSFVSLPPPTILACHYIFRGIDISEEQIEHAIDRVYHQKSRNQVPFQTTYWIPNSCSVSYCRRPYSHSPKSLISFINDSSIQHLFKAHSEVLNQLLRRKAFLHIYLSTGMDELEFTEAESSLNDLISEYVPSGYYMYDESFFEEEEDFIRNNDDFIEEEE